MDRNIASILALASTAAVSVTLAAIAPGDAYADDISVDTTQFSSSRTRADLRSELLSQPAIVKMNAGELAMQYNYLPPISSVATRGQVTAEYKASRDDVRKLLGEDSGSSYLAKSAQTRGATAIMGGPSP